jgi:methyltransferase
MAGHIARALSVFCVDEVVIFSDGHTHPQSSRHHTRHHSFAHAPDPADDPYTGTSDPDHFLVHLLSYLETPPHLRRLLFPLHPNLRTAGTLPSLDLPHHLRTDEWCAYREGVTLKGDGNGAGTRVEAGLRVPVTVPDEIPENTRVTLKFDEKAKEANKNAKEKVIRGEAVSPDEPREEGGYYWGFNVRKAASLSNVFTECSFEGGYDMTIGTSERGVDVEALCGEHEEQKVGKFKHLLIVFGGVAGLEVAVKNDTELQKLAVVEAKDVFDRWVNVCPGQGSRTIRTEEAVWIGLMGLRRLVVSNE